MIRQKERKMASLTIRNLDDTVKEKLRIRAASHGRSMEEEVRLILNQAINAPSGQNLWQRSRELFDEKNAIDLELPNRGQDRQAPDWK
jgi:plasmid stability protein